MNVERGAQRILFGQDIHGSFNVDFGLDIMQWRESMDKLLDLKAENRDSITICKIIK